MTPSVPRCRPHLQAAAVLVQEGLRTQREAAGKLLSSLPLPLPPHDATEGVNTQTIGASNPCGNLTTIDPLTRR